MDVSPIVISLGLALFVGMALSASSISALIRMRRRSTRWISALPTTGTVAVTGTVCETTFLSPMTKTPCAVYKLEIQEYNKYRRGSGWATINHKDSTKPFEIEDGTGSVQVYPSGAELTFSYVNFVENLDAEQNAALDRLGIATSGFFNSNRNLRVTEYLIIPGQTIFVQGVVQQNDEKKSISNGGGGDLVISDQGEEAVLKGLLSRIWKTFFFSFVAGIAFIFIYYYKQ